MLCARMVSYYHLYKLKNTMTLTKNIVAILCTFVLAVGFALTSQTAFASTNEKVDVCETDAYEADDSNEADGEDENDAEDLCEQAESARLALTVTVSEKAARATAIAHNKDKGSITELILATDEDDKGKSRVVYEIEFSNASGVETDVKVDAMTGVYLGLDIEDDEEDDDAGGGEITGANTRDLQVQLITLLKQLIGLLKQ